MNPKKALEIQKDMERITKEYGDKLEKAAGSIEFFVVAYDRDNKEGISCGYSARNFHKPCNAAVMLQIMVQSLMDDEEVRFSKEMILKTVEEQLEGKSDLRHGRLSELLNKDELPPILN